MTPYVSLSEAARLYRIHASTLGAAIRRGELRAARVGKRKLQIRPVDIERWIDCHMIAIDNNEPDVSTDVEAAQAQGMR